MVTNISPYSPTTIEDTTYPTLENPIITTRYALNPYTQDNNYIPPQGQYLPTPFQTSNNPIQSSSSLPPLPPPSDYWRQRAKENVNRPLVPAVDYSDCDRTSMDFRYGQHATTSSISRSHSSSTSYKNRDKSNRNQQQQQVDKEILSELVLTSSETM